MTPESIKGLEFGESHTLTPEQKETAARGDLTRFLQGKFLRGAVIEGLMTPERSRDIPELLNDLVGSIFPQEGEQPLFSEARVLSSVAKGLAWTHITGEMPQSFWKYYAHAKKLKTMFEKSHSEVLQDYAKSYAETTVDLDVLLMPIETTSVIDIGQRVAQRFQIPKDQIKPIARSKQEQFTFPWKNYNIHVAYGHHPTADIDLVKIYIRDPKSKRELFHVDVTKAGNKSDKRTGTTTLKQDECIAQLTHENGRLVYTMGKDAIDVMRGQDSFDTDKTDTGGLLEVFFRGLRQNLLHTLHDQEKNTDYVLLPEEKRLDLPQFAMFFPRFMSGSDTSASMFGLQTKLLELKFQGELLLPYKNRQFMRMLQKELALCLTIDPYTTIQALRDSGVALAIPGLQDLTEKDWNKTLTSLHMMMDLATMTAFPRNPDLEYMVKQRDIYLGHIGLWKDEKPIHFDGLERSIQALYKTEQPQKAEECWKSYLRLWYERRLPPATVSREKFPDGRALKIPIRGEKAFLKVVRSDGKPISLDRIFDMFDMYSMEHQREKEPKISWKKQVKKVLDDIDGSSHAPWVSAALSGDKSERRFIGIRRKEPERLQSLGLIAAILRQTPGSVTPKQLEVIYNHISQNSGLFPFSAAFFELKLTGFVARNVKKRVNKHGDIVDMPTYCWKNPGMRTSLSDSSVRNNLFPFYDQVVGQGTFYQATVRREEFEEAMDRFGECHIHSTEVLESLSPEHDGPHFPEEHRAKILQDIRILQLALAKQREETDEW